VHVAAVFLSVAFRPEIAVITTPQSIVARAVTVYIGCTQHTKATGFQHTVKLSNKLRGVLKVLNAFDRTHRVEITICKRQRLIGITNNPLCSIRKIGFVGVYVHGVNIVTKLGGGAGKSPCSTWQIKNAGTHFWIILVQKSKGLLVCTLGSCNGRPIHIG